MKKIVMLVMGILLCCAMTAVAAPLKVGDPAPDFSLKDSTGKAYSLQHPDYKGMVMSIFYVDPDEKDLNAHVEDALMKDTALDRGNRYKGLGITNLKATVMPNFLIKRIIKGKQEKTGAVILLDYDQTLLNLWGLQDNTSSLVVLDKDRICRYVYNGKLPPEEVQKVLSLIKEYQEK